MEGVENFVVCVKAALCVRVWMFFQGEGTSCPPVLCWICCESSVEVVPVWVRGFRSSLRMWVFAGCCGGVVPGWRELALIIFERLTALQDRKSL